MQTLHSPSLAVPRHGLSRLTLAILAGLQLGSAWAAPAPREEAAPRPDEVVVVEGRKAYAGGQVAADNRVGLLGNKPFLETPFNTVSYTEEYIEDRQAQDIGAVAGATNPSVYVPSKRSLFETFYIRGFNTNANDITFNGLIGMAPNMRSSTEMAARVDVLKGPSVLLNGMPPDGSVGGNINIVPKRAGKTPLAKVTASYESDGLGGVHLDLGRRFGDEQQWGVRFNGERPAAQDGAYLGRAGLAWRTGPRLGRSLPAARAGGRGELLRHLLGRQPGDPAARAQAW